ncbi:GLPGLI family protein [Daejeonia sp. YH14]|uniref:GLPGLI family protein n=1 Tax=Daejeonia sp. YH14 TaxID=3439042 RepID=UPI003F492BAF
MKKTIVIFFCFLNILCYSQQIHVQYIYVKSPIVTLHENLYINNKKNVISIQDSIISNARITNNLNPDAPKSVKSPAMYYISDLSINDKKDFYYLDNIDSEVFFVYDKNVPQPKWTIYKSDKKKIAGYECFKAEGTFRGSNITAYYSPKLPYSAGPYKFFGLPGLILFVKVKDKAFDIWKAEKVEIENFDKIKFKPELNQYEKIEMRHFVNMKDEKGLLFEKKIQKDAPLGSTYKSLVPNNRFGVEKKYEWE